MADFYFVATVGNAWETSDNWFEVDLTTPLSAVPTTGDVVFITDNCSLNSSVDNTITVESATILTVDTAATLSGTLTIDGTLTINATSTLSGAVTINGGMVVNGTAICTSSLSIDFVTASYTAGAATAILRISGTASTTGTMAFDGDWQILAGGALTIPAGATITYSFSSAGDGFVVAGTLTIEGTFTNVDGVVTVESTGTIAVAAGGIFDSYDCNVNGGAITNAGTVKLSAFILLLNGATYTQDNATGKTEIIGAGVFDINDFEDSAEIVDYPAEPAINFW